MHQSSPPANAHSKYIIITVSEPEPASTATAAPDAAGPKKNNTDPISTPGTTARFYSTSSTHDSFDIEQPNSNVRSRTEAIPWLLGSPATVECTQLQQCISRSEATADTANEQ